MLDSAFKQLYDDFVERGGLDQTTNIVDEDFERVERQAAYCLHGVAKRVCPFCRKPDSTHAFAG
jgi:hypothetical protein